MPMPRTEADDALFTPRMPEVEQPKDLAAVFDQARAAAATGTRAADGSIERRIVVVTPGRLLMLQPCPPQGSMSATQVAGIKKMIAPEPQRRIAVIGYTELAALRANIAAAIPFIGILLGFAYIGHAVWVFEGHPSALAHGCHAADLLLVDGGMLPHLQADWQTVVAAVMRRPEIYLHDRQTFRLSRPARVPSN